MKLYNRTTKQLLIEKLKYASGIFDRTIGLLPYAGLEDNEGMFLTNTHSIHTFFMRFPINCYFLDKDNKVLRIKNNVKPYRFAAGPFGRTVNTLETSALNTESLNISIGDELEVVE